MTETVSPKGHRNPIEESAGARYLARAHSRTFSFNIFQMNALELMEASRRVRDQHLGFSLMLEKNREAGLQAHRELSRHVHNFVSSALTLVEHTRVFMRKHYERTEVLKVYEQQVSATFAEDPVANFVQGLRNYMLHKGLPNSYMFLSFESNPSAADGSGATETGVRYDTASLLEWDGWKPRVRRYLADAGHHLDVHRFVEDYLVLVNRFHQWLHAALEVHHQKDLSELAEMQAIAKSQAGRSHYPSAEAPVSENSEPFEYSEARGKSLDDIALGLLGRIQPILFGPAHTNAFPTQRQVAAAITEEDVIGTPMAWAQDANGRRMFAFIRKDSQTFGLSEEDYRSLDELVASVFATSTVRERLSASFLEDTFIDWARESYCGGTQTFTVRLSEQSQAKIGPVEVWAPIDHLEVEESFDFGPISIRTITAEKLDEIGAIRSNARADQQESVQALVKKLKEDLQGFAAVVLSIDADHGLAKERGRLIGQDAVDLLRLFSSASADVTAVCPIALKGTDLAPTSTLFALSEGRFSMKQGALNMNARPWRISSRELNHMRSNGLAELASLVLPTGLSEFASKLRSSLILFSKGLTLADPIDRLGHTLSALEGILLRHEMEPVSASVASRMSFLLSKNPIEREQVAQDLRRAYWIRDRPRISPPTRSEQETLAKMAAFSCGVLLTALINIKTIPTRSAFVTAVDRSGMS